eukprot:4513252-Alexandrium_andersonii.AAC.1
MHGAHSQSAMHPHWQRSGPIPLASASPHVYVNCTFSAACYPGLRTGLPGQRRTFMESAWEDSHCLLYTSPSPRD